VAATKFALFDNQRYHSLWSLVHNALSLTPTGERVFPFAHSTYGSCSKTASEAAGLKFTETRPFAARWLASGSIARGVPPQNGTEAGRWVAGSLIRIYGSVFGAKRVLQAFALGGRQEKIRWLSVHADKVDSSPLQGRAARAA